MSAEKIRINQEEVKNVARYLNKLAKNPMHSVIRYAKKIMSHSRRTVLLESDINEAIKFLGFDRIIGYEGKEIVMDILSKEGETKEHIINLNSILAEPMEDMPKETSYSVNWLVIDGKQISNVEEYNEETDDHKDVELRKPDIHSLTFECELYMNKIKSRMYSNNALEKEAIFHQLEKDPGLKQLLPYLVNWIESEMQKMVRSKPEAMLEYMMYLMRVMHCLLVNPHLNVILYMHLLCPCVLTCCVGKTLSYSAAEDHWALRDRAALLIADIVSKYGRSYPKLHKQILITLNKVLHNPKSTLPSVYGAITGITNLGITATETVLLPIYQPLFSNLTTLLQTASAAAEFSIRRCMAILTESMGLFVQSQEKKLEANPGNEAIQKEVGEALAQLPPSDQVGLTENLIAICNQPNDKAYNLCNYCI